LDAESDKASVGESEEVSDDELDDESSEEK
ncbi:hypothetical protein Tco_0667657, partial [Tanacetum coccineum]